MNSSLVSYYKDRAKEYEKVYNKPERQEDLLIAGQILQDTFADHNVFEIACGTGYWTEKISATAKNILATDINETVMDVAKAKKYSQAKVDFQTEDIFKLAASNKHDGLFGGFIWSHIKLQDLSLFIDIINGLVTKGGTVALMDNKYVRGNSLPISKKDDFGNTFQTRTLENGATYEVLKNFPSERFIRELLTEKASEINFSELEYYWILKYKTF